MSYPIWRMIDWVFWCGRSLSGWCISSNRPPVLNIVSPGKQWLISPSSFQSKTKKEPMEMLDSSWTCTFLLYSKDGSHKLRTNSILGSLQRHTAHVFVDLHLACDCRENGTKSTQRRSWTAFAWVPKCCNCKNMEMFLIETAFLLLLCFLQTL